MAALALEAVWLLEQFVDLPWCVSWVALTFTVGWEAGRKPAGRQPALERN